MQSTERLLIGFKSNARADLTIMVVTVNQVMVMVVVMLAMFVKRYGVPTVAANVWAATSFVVVR